jgi:putative endonuclease
MKNYYVYIMSNRTQVLYIGVTGDLARRIYQHKHKLTPGFTSHYNLERLVYVEHTHAADFAIAREKQLKGWSRSKKIALIEGLNPKWSDLSREWGI